MQAVRSGPCWRAFPEFQERSAELRSSVQSALLYPIVLVGVAVVAVLTMIFSWCQFEATFRQFWQGVAAGHREPAGTVALAARRRLDAADRAAALVIWFAAACVRRRAAELAPPQAHAAGDG